MKIKIKEYDNHLTILLSDYQRVLDTFSKKDMKHHGVEIFDQIFNENYVNG